MNYRLIIILLLISKISAFAQDEGNSKFAKAIEDNSYSIEEAYNQEDGVVQHISNGYYTFSPSKDFMYTFTQEWPVVSQKHQLSYTVGYSWLNSNKVNGFSDVLINYRYQLTRHDDFITIAPRISVILPIFSFSISGNSHIPSSAFTFNPVLRTRIIKKENNFFI